MQRYNERVITSEPATPATAVPVTPPDMTYRSLSCNSRIAQQELLEVMSRSPASSKHLQVPQNAITHETLQVGYHVPHCWHAEYLQAIVQQAAVQLSPSTMRVFLHPPSCFRKPVDLS